MLNDEQAEVFARLIAEYEAAAEVERLRKEVEALRADALRYRWLRLQHWDEADVACVKRPKDAVKLGHDCPSLERLDAAIDAAMTKEPTNG